MDQKQYKSKVYNGDSWNAPKKSSKNGLCLSGGGSRALTAGLGQLIGLRSCYSQSGKTLLDSVDYISSVSGGTWLTSIYSFSKNKDLDDLLGVYVPPNQLTKENIGHLPKGSIGHVPSRLSDGAMFDIVRQEIGLSNIWYYSQVRKWIWPVIIGELVLRPYDLYNGIMVGEGENKTLMPDRYFSLNPAHMDQNIKALKGNGVVNESLTNDDFYFHQSERPFPILNTNIKLNYQQAYSTLLPVQATPIAIGVTGKACDSGVTLSADGGVEAFAFTSNWQSQNVEEAIVDIERRYSLVDIVACSSAFFAEMVGKSVANTAKLFAIAHKDELGVNQDDPLEDIEATILKDLFSLVPQYNYWPAGKASPENQNTGFADGGNLDNTGVLGMLARSDATNIVVCYNAETSLGSKEDIAVEGFSEKVALISSDIPVLFGYQPKPVDGTYVLMNDQSPIDVKEREAAKVFEPTEFGPLLKKLFAASQGQKSPTVARTSSLKVCDNPFAGIRNRGNVDILWIYNNYAEDWIKEISKTSWCLAHNIKWCRFLPWSDFYNFPHYSTITQVELNATSVNTLAQFQAWVIHQVSDQIIEMFFSA